MPATPPNALAFDLVEAEAGRAVLGLIEVLAAAAGPIAGGRFWPPRPLRASWRLWPRPS